MGAMAEKVYGFYMPTVSLLGLGAVKQVGQQAKVLGGTKALIVTDAGLARIGVADQIKGYLEEAGLSVTVFDGAEPNPTDLNVRDCLKVWQDNGC
ncbi:MAG: iron-containing alcohol dehydrogenase, partial [Syntrophotalea acetylenica]|nr:iron-containing alcohol dehydrogenase [Syntrophotalea acetylenica]